MQFAENLSLFGHLRLGGLSSCLIASQPFHWHFFFSWHISIVFAFQFSLLVFETIVTFCKFALFFQQNSCTFLLCF